MPELSRHFINPGPEVVRQSRRLVADSLDAWGVRRRRDDAVLSTSELVTNVLLHADSDHLALHLWLRHRCLRLEVHDRIHGPVSLCTPSACDVTGRGLLPLQRVADRWGSYDRPPGLGKVVFAEFEIA